MSRTTRKPRSAGYASATGPWCWLRPAPWPGAFQETLVDELEVGGGQGPRRLVELEPVHHVGEAAFLELTLRVEEIALRVEHHDPGHQPRRVALRHRVHHAFLGGDGF